MDGAETALCCEKEIVELHRFFTDWFHGTHPATEAAWSRVTGVLAPSFALVSPEGLAFGRDDLLAAIRARHGSHAQTRDFEIWIRRLRCRYAEGRVALATYEEWQRRPGGDAGRLSTAVFEEDPDTPNGLRWLHVHETWLPATHEGGSPAAGR